MDKIKYTLLIVCILLCQHGLAFDNECNSPRIGDKIMFHRLSGEPAWTDSARLSPDLSSVTISRSTLMQVFAPLPADTLSTMIVAFSTTVMNIGEKEGLICHIADHIPGETRKYSLPYPLNFNIQYGKEYQIQSEGLINEVDHFTTSGTISGKRILGLNLTIDSDRKLQNLSCIESMATDTFQFDRTEPFIHNRTVSEWYAPGYRYPLLRKQEDNLTSLQGDIIDNISSWYMTSPDEQEESVKEDPINESLRNALRESERKPFIPTGKNPESEGDKNTGPDIKQTGNEVILSSNPSMGLITEVLLCDISGKVYSYQSFTDGETQITISTSGLQPGLYILHITYGNDSATYKFNI